MTGENSVSTIYSTTLREGVPPRTPYYFPRDDCKASGRNAKVGAGKQTHHFNPKMYIPLVDAPVSRYRKPIYRIAICVQCSTEIGAWYDTM